MKKCEFGKFEVKYLRYVVGCGKMYMNDEKVQSMRNWPALISIIAIPYQVIATIPGLCQL